MKRKYKSLVTLYHDFDSEYVETFKPREEDGLKPEYIVSRKGSVFTLNEQDLTLENKSNKMLIVLDNLSDIDELIVRGWFKELK